MDKTVLSLDDLMVDSFTTTPTTAADSEQVGIVWTGCMSECTEC